MTERNKPTFVHRMGEHTAYKVYAATLEFYEDNDICGEGYGGWDYLIRFDDIVLISELWWVEGSMWTEPETSRPHVLKEAIEHYGKVVELIQRLRATATV